MNLPPIPAQSPMPDCPICLAPLAKNVIISRCNHLFHTRCMQGWTCAGNDTCPSCRTPNFRHYSSSCEDNPVALSPILEGAAIHEVIEKIGAVGIKRLFRYKLERLRDFVNDEEVNHSARMDDQTFQITKSIYSRRKEKHDLFSIILEIDTHLLMKKEGCWFAPYGDIASIEDLNTKLGWFKQRHKFEWTLEFSLRNLDLATIPPINLNIFSYFKKIDLSENKLTYLPPGIKDFVCIKIFTVNNNQLKSLPQEIGDLTELEELHAENNLISELPRELKKCTKLKLINLQNNPIAQSLDEIKALLPKNCQIIV